MARQRARATHRLDRRGLLSIPLLGLLTVDAAAFVNPRAFPRKVVHRPPAPLSTKVFSQVTSGAEPPATVGPWEDVPLQGLEELQDHQMLLQEAVDAEEILSLASLQVDSLKPSVLSQALLRMGKSLGRQSKRNDPRLEHLLSTWLNNSHAAVHHHVDLLVGLALLEYQAPDFLVNGIMKTLSAASDDELLYPEHLSTDLAWALRRLGRPSTLLPSSLKAATEALPFRVLPGLLGDYHFDLEMLQQEVSFQKLVVMNIDGKDIEESRLTAWQGRRSCFHNGKELKASPMTSTVRRIRDLLHQRTGVFFDGVLLNLYKDGSVGKHYHADPDELNLWSDKTAIVSLGQSRHFCLRRRARQRHHQHHHGDRHRFLLSDGDVVLMFGDCQDNFQHCVDREQGEVMAGGPRVSLVFKQSLVRIARKKRDD